jgi:branched-chain amino acid transport system permease protein
MSQTGFPRTLTLGSRPHRLWQAAGLLLALGVVVLLPVTSEDFRLTQFAQLVPYAVAVLGLNVLTGYSGQVSLGHVAFFGLGAYTSAILVTDHGWPYLATIPVAGAAGLALGIVVGIPALRVRGLYLAVVTLAVGVAFPVMAIQPFAQRLGSGGVAGKPVFIQWQKPGWFNLDVTNAGWKFLVMTAVAAGMFWLATGITRGQLGRALLALRDNETAAATSGAWPAGLKTGAFAVSSAYGAVGGSLYVLFTPIVSPESLGFLITLLFITAMVVGGATTVAGAWIGGAVMVFLPDWAGRLAGELTLFDALSTQPVLFANVIFGVILITVVFLMPQGIAPFFTSLRERWIRFVPPGVPTPHPIEPGDGARTVTEHDPTHPTGDASHDHAPTPDAPGDPRRAAPGGDRLR